jgi:glycosyltransferase involved in cell wall biosynthesis
MSNVILEGMAATRPIVAFDVEGVADTIGDRASLQIVTTADQSGFIKRVVDIAHNQQLRSELGAANRRRIESEFTIDKMIAKYERLFLALCRPSTAL